MNIVRDIRGMMPVIRNAWKNRQSEVTKEQAFKQAQQEGYRVGRIRGEDAFRARNQWYPSDGMPNTGNYYPGAELGRERNDWITRICTSTTLLRQSYRTLCARAEFAYRTEPYAKRLIDLKKTFTVGSGCIPFPRVKNKNGTLVDGINNILKADWQRFNEEAYRVGSQSVTALEAQGIEYEGIATMGSILRQTVKSRPGSWLPFAFTWVKPYRLNFAFDNYFDDLFYRMFLGDMATGDAPDNLKSGNMVILGQIFNKFMETQAFHIYGEPESVSADVMSIHFKQREAEQYLGIPWLTPVLGDIWDLQQLVDDKLLQSRNLTRIGFMIDKRDRPQWLDAMTSTTDDPDPNESVSIARSTAYSGTTKPEPIMMDDKISDSIEPLMKLVLHRVAVGMDMSYQLLSSDLNGASYSGSRTNTITDEKGFAADFAWFTRCNCQPLWNKFVEWEFLTGKIPGATYAQYLKDPHYYNKCYWLAEPTEWFDPLEKAKAQRLLLQTAQITLEELCEEDGRNWKDVIDQRATEKEYIKLKKLEELLPTYAERPTPAALPDVEDKIIPGEGSGGSSAS